VLFLVYVVKLHLIEVGASQLVRVVRLVQLVRVERIPSSQLNWIVSVSNDVQFHQFHDSNELKGPPSSKLYWTVSLNNDMQFYHLNDSFESYELTRALPWNDAQILSVYNDIQRDQ